MHPRAAAFRNDNDSHSAHSATPLCEARRKGPAATGNPRPGKREEVTAKAGMAFFLSLTSFFILGAAVAAEAVAAEAMSEKLSQQISFNIPSQPLSTALKQLADQAGIQILFEEQVVRGHAATALKARQTAAEALTALLANTDLEFIAKDETVAVRKKSERLPTVPAAGAHNSSPRRGGEGFLREGEGMRLVRADDRFSKEGGNTRHEEFNTEQVFEEVVVTGSRIRGHQNPASQIYTVTSQEIEKRGFTSTDDIFRSIPQVSGRGSMQAMEVNDQAPAGSMGRSTINLGGFGAKSTLVLINGRRTVNSSALWADSVDVSSIPPSAIERVEILPTAAAAIYGADAAGGVVNIILKQRSEFESDTRVHYEDGSNGGEASQVSQDLSFGWGSGRFTGVASYREVDPVTSRDIGHTTQDFRSRGGYDMRSLAFGQTGLITGLGSLPPGDDGATFAPGDVSAANIIPASSIAEYVTPRVTTTSAYINAEQELGSSVRLFVDALYADKDIDNFEIPQAMYGVAVPATNAFNPFGAPVFVTYQFDTERDAGQMQSLYRESDGKLWQGTLGATIDLPREWQLQVYGTRAEDESFHTYVQIAYWDDPAVLSALADGNPQTALNLFGNGTAQNPETLSRLTSYWLGKPHNRLVADMTLFSVQADGVLFELPSGAVKGSFVVERREDQIDNTGFGPTQPKAGRTADSIGAEFAVPLLGRNSSQLLDLTLAARWDRYNAEGYLDTDRVKDRMDEFSATSPMVGLAWQPIEDLRLRASWNKAFRSPVVRDLVPSSFVRQLQITDPLAPGGPAQAVVNVLFPASPELGPEKAKTWTVGVDWQHLDASDAGLTASLTYSNTEFADRIASAFNYFNLDPGYFITHPEIFPNATQRNANGILTDVYMRNINIAEQKAKGLSLDAAYSWPTVRGLDFSVRTFVTYTDTFVEKLGASAASKELAGTFRGPDRLRATLRATVASDRQAWTANLFVNTSSSYDHDIPISTIRDAPVGAGSIIAEKVKGYTTVDLTGSYQHRKGSWFDGVTLTGGIRNLLDEDFPLINLSQGGRVLPFDPSRVDVRGRVMFLELGKTFR